MSEYGPAIFISRTDAQPLSDDEQSTLEQAVAEACRKLRMRDPMDDSPVEPWRYDYDGYESGALGIVLWANYAFGEAPDFIQEDMNADAASDGKKIMKQLEAQWPKTYRAVCYMVEC